MGGAATSRRCRGLGLAGSVLLAAGGLLAGAVPARHGVPLPGLGHLHRSEAVGLILVHAGVTVLVVAWWRLGAVVRAEAPGTRGLCLTLAVWAGPLLFVPPLPAVWQHTPTPYGPVFLTVAAVVAAAASSHILLGVLGMRLLAVLGLAVMLAACPASPPSTASHRPPRCGWPG